MAKIKIRATQEDIEQSNSGDFVEVPEGYHWFQLAEAKSETSKTGSPMLVTIWKCVGIGREGVKPEANYGQVWDYIVLGGDAGWKVAQFGLAIGLKVKRGQIDEEVEIEKGKPGTIVGRKVLARVKHETYEGTARAKIRSYIAVNDEAPDTLDEAPEEDDADYEGEEAFEAYTEEELSEMDAAGLKEVAEEFELEVPTGRGAKAKLIAAILEAQEEEEEEEEEGDEAEGDDEYLTEDGLLETDLASLRKLAESDFDLDLSGITGRGAKAKIVAAILEAQGVDEEPF